VDWINLAQDKGQWRVLVSSVTNSVSVKRRGKFLIYWMYCQRLKEDSDS
jgi:hypothetical protein